MARERLQLPPAARRSIREAAGAAWPREACGLLEGTTTGSSTRVVRVSVNANVDAEPDRRYTIDPEAFLYAEHAARGRGHEIVGTWHSHPHGDPAPSASDHAEAWPGWSYLIAGVTNGVMTALRCWRLHDGEFREQAIVGARIGPRPDDRDSEVHDERT